MDFSLLATLLLLIGLELVLGIDNILLISILTDRLPEHQRAQARKLGLGLALAARCVLLLAAASLVKLSEPVIFGLSWKSLILIAGGGFLLFKAVKEIHHVVEKTHQLDKTGAATAGFAAILLQILAIDMVFSIDSVITAVGLTDSLWVIYSSVLVSFALILAFSGSIASFIQSNPTLKILALSFLVTIGVTLVIEGIGGHVPKGYIYLPMGFALVVEVLQLRFAANQRRAG